MIERKKSDMIKKNILVLVVHLILVFLNITQQTIEYLFSKQKTKRRNKNQLELLKFWHY